MKSNSGRFNKKEDWRWSKTRELLENWLKSRIREDFWNLFSDVSYDLLVEF